MDLCDKYLLDFINIYPPMNDYLLYSKFTKKQGSNFKVASSCGFQLEWLEVSIND